MAAKGYATPAQVAAYMGATFTPAQASICDYAISAAETWIDNETQHAWLETGPITEVIYNPQKTYLWLKKAPILSVTSIVASAPLCADIPLTVDANYFLQDIRDGRIYSPFTVGTYKVTVVYEPNVDPVPDDIHLAAMIAAASNMRLTPALLDGVDPNVVQRYNVGGELEVEFRKNLLSGVNVPMQVLTLLDNWRRNYVIV